MKKEPPQESSSNEAIELLEWVKNEGWEPAPKEFKMWYRKLVGEKLQRKSSADLYNLFKQSKP